MTVPRWVFTYRDGETEPSSFFVLQGTENPLPLRVTTHTVVTPSDVVKVHVSHDSYTAAEEQATEAVIERG